MRGQSEEGKGRREGKEGEGNYEREEPDLPNGCL